LINDKVALNTCRQLCICYYFINSFWWETKLPYFASWSLIHFIMYICYSFISACTYIPYIY